MKGSLALLLVLVVSACCTGCRTQPSNEILITGLTNGEPIVQVSTNVVRKKLLTGVEKRTPDVKPEKAGEWRKMYDHCSEALIKNAREAGLDADSLEQILKTLLDAEENKGLAVVPVAAHQTRRDGEEVWIVTLKWEGEDGTILAHIRWFTFTRKDLKQIGFFYLWLNSRP